MVSTKRLRSSLRAAALFGFLMLVVSPDPAVALCPPSIADGESKQTGGWSSPMQPDDTLREVLQRSNATDLLVRFVQANGDGEGVEPQHVKLCFYEEQVVAGANYRVTASVDDASPTYYELFVHSPLPHRNELPVVENISRMGPMV